MHPTSGNHHVWRHRGRRQTDGYWEMRWWVGPHTDRKMGSQLEHRWIWERDHGKIPPGHDVHHLNNDRTDTRPENLECVPTVYHIAEHGRARRKWREVDGRWERRCARCDQWLGEDAYSSRTRSTCRECHKAYLRERRQAEAAAAGRTLRRWTRRS